MLTTHLLLYLKENENKWEYVPLKNIKISHTLNYTPLVFDNLSNVDV